MSTFTRWLEAKTEELAQQISSHPVFESEQPASADELRQLRTMCVVHRFLSQELERRTNGGTAAGTPLSPELTAFRAA